MQLRLIVLFVFTLTLTPAISQIRFYAQFRSIPFTEASTNNFNLLTGIKIDPNKEILFGLGLSGTLSPKELKGDVKFNKSSLTLSFNYYLNRRLYLNGELNYNLVGDVITDLVEDDPIVGASRNLLKKFFFDYDINVTYIFLQRLHFSFGTGLADFAQLAKSTTDEIIEGKFQFNVALSLKVYMFQIKY